MSKSDDKPKDNKPLGVKHVVISVLAAALGVQSEKNRKKDFNNKNSIYIYIAAGIMFTLLFILAIYSVVTLVLANT